MCQLINSLTLCWKDLARSLGGNKTMIKIRRNNNQMQNFSSFSILVNEILFSCKICFCLQQGQQFWVMNIRKIDSDENRSLELWSEGKKLFFVEFCPLLIDHQLCEIWVNSKSKRATYEKAYPWKNLQFSILSDEERYKNTVYCI